VNRRERPLLIYDGACDFCLQWVARWREMTGDRVEYQPYQEIAHFFPEIELDRFEASVQMIDEDEVLHSGADAVLRLLTINESSRWRYVRRLYDRVPGFARLTEAAYAWISRRRGIASAITRALWAEELERPQYFIVRWVFLRGLALIYLIAIASLWSQLLGLVGSQGIQPAVDSLAAASEQFGGAKYWRFPTLFWVNASDNALNILSCMGCICALALLMNRKPRFFATACWLIYLSLYTVGGSFLSFQWDVLLLETGFLGILLAQTEMRPRFELEKPVPRTLVLLLRWLLFRLMFMSAVVKLMSGDAAWWNLSALAYHYESQPLPMPTAWVMHQLPMFFHRISALGMFAIELLLPFLIFAPRGPRALVAVVFVWFQLLIIATGNYTFFNGLTILLCVPLLDDSYLSRFVKPHFLVSKAGRTYAQVLTRRDLMVGGVVAALIVSLSTAHMMGRFFGYRQLPQPVLNAITWTNPFHLTSSYGLFAVMTKGRREIIFEGSNDGKNWKAYEFRWKPDRVDKRPRMVAPHQPRLDWQLWFAALSDYRRQPWLSATMRRLLEGSEPVLGLFADNPFEGSPPRYVRAMIWDYRFTGSDSSSDDWWVREHPRLYAPVLSRK
jgi:predicted DCC family thiol-disulfide oxidoreductase YuxK